VGLEETWAVKPLSECIGSKGTTPRVWKDIPEFFTPLQIAGLGGDDGFFRLLRPTRTSHG